MVLDVSNWMFHKSEIRYFLMIFKYFKVMIVLGFLDDYIYFVVTAFSHPRRPKWNLVGFTDPNHDFLVSRIKDSSEGLLWLLRSSFIMYLKKAALRWDHENKSIFFPLISKKEEFFFKYDMLWCSAHYISVKHDKLFEVLSSWWGNI